MASGEEWGLSAAHAYRGIRRLLPLAQVRMLRCLLGRFSHWLRLICCVCMLGCFSRWLRFACCACLLGRFSRWLRFACCACFARSLLPLAQVRVLRCLLRRFSRSLRSSKSISQTVVRLYRLSHRLSPHRQHRRTARDNGQPLSFADRQIPERTPEPRHILSHEVKGRLQG